MEGALGGALLDEFTEAALVLYWATVGRMLASIRPAIVWTGIGAGAAAIVLQAIVLTAGRGVTVFPNPYRGSAVWDADRATGRYLWFAGLPARALIKIFSLAGDRVAEIDRLRVHVKENILYYMQAIWRQEPPDQRFFRLYDLTVPIVTADENATASVIAGPGALGPQKVWERLRGTDTVTVKLPPTRGSISQCMMLPVREANRKRAARAGVNHASKTRSGGRL